MVNIQRLVYRGLTTLQIVESSTLKEMVMSLLQGKGFLKLRCLWRGMGATLAKDVPFAAGYWMLMEPMRTLLLPPNAEHAMSRSQVGPVRDHAVLQCFEVSNWDLVAMLQLLALSSSCSSSMVQVCLSL